MERMGFCQQWIQLVLNCISTASYSILVNGEPKGDIRPSRGIRQGDPLSPYLFIICSERLNRQIQKAARDDLIRGFSLCRSGPKTTHIFFADDTLLFCLAKMGDLQVIQDILQLYEKASGQKINRNKTMVFFSKATNEGRKEEVKDFLGVSEVREYERYLDLPIVVGKKNKKASLNYIKERVWNKLQG